MMQAPLPSMPEYDPLDEHLADLEEPGANLMQEFVLRGTAAPATFNTTPLSVSNGYTSEESDYSVTTPSDEQMYADMTFMETADTSELVEVVADYVEDNDLTALSPKTQRVFADKQAGAYAAGKMIKGKTSKYRGVTQTSKTSWGAKYSAKRITNTCKTQDEAARAYDLYLKENHPEKYPKFANFCVRCDRFVNPLGLPEFRNECCCDATSDGGSTEVESPPAASETDGDDLATIDSKVFVQGMDIHDNNIPVREGSNLSIGSLKLSFLDDLDVSMLPPQDHQQISVDGNKPIKRDSLTMAAVESFSNEDNLDHIIKDINRSSSSSFSKKPSFTRNNSLGHSVGLNSSSSTTVNDFSPEEWQNLSDYLMSDHGQPGVLPAPVPTMANMQTAEQQRSKLNKLHSLDFDATEPVEHMDIKQEYPSAMDVDDLASAFMPPPMMNNQVATPTPAVPSQTHSSVAFPARVNIQTPFLEKYWRNDRKNIQCFPYCPEHGDYYRVRIENLQHRCKGVCRAAVKAHVTVPTTQLLSPSGLLLLARCNSTFSRNVALSAQQFLNVTEIKNLQSLSSVGVVEQFGVLPDGSGVQFEVTFYPDVWKFEFDLPKKRRHGSAADELDAANSEFLYFFEIDVFYTTEKTLFQRLGHAESMSFQIGNTRTLLRQRNRMNEEPSDADRILGMDAMPEKKKVRMYLGQHGRNSTILSEDSEYVDQAVVQNAKLGDSDALNRIDSKDSTVDLEAGSSSAKPWKHHDDDETDEPTSYGQYVSPKSAKTLLGGTEASTTATMVKSGAKAAHDAERDNLDATIKGADETHSSSKLFAYSLVSIPLSIVFMPLTLFLLIGFVIVPPTAGSIVRLLDAISDMELRRANSSCIRTDSRIVLDRLDTGKGKGMFRYHSEGAVWSRFVYFCGVKLVITIVMFVPVLLFSLLGVISFPIRPLSKSLFRSANACSLVSREYTRKSVGKPYSNHASTQGDALV